MNWPHIGTLGTIRKLEHIKILGHIETIGHIGTHGHIRTLGHIGTLGHIATPWCSWNQKVAKIWHRGKLYGKLTLGYVLSTSNKPEILRSGPFWDIEV